MEPAKVYEPSEESCFSLMVSREGDNEAARMVFEMINAAVQACPWIDAADKLYFDRAANAIARDKSPCKRLGLILGLHEGKRGRPDVDTRYAAEQKLRRISNGLLRDAHASRRLALHVSEVVHRLSRSASPSQDVGLAFGFRPNPVGTRTWKTKEHYNLALKIEHHVRSGYSIEEAVKRVADTLPMRRDGLVRSANRLKEIRVRHKVTLKADMHLRYGLPEPSNPKIDI